jgi:hypothetical protein
MEGHGNMSLKVVIGGTCILDWIAFGRFARLSGSRRTDFKALG